MTTAPTTPKELVMALLPYTTLTIDTTPFGAIDAPLVVLGDWAHSTTSSDGRTEVASVRRHDAIGHIIERHPTLHEVTYPLGEARRAAYNAGILGYFVKVATS